MSSGQVGSNMEGNRTCDSCQKNQAEMFCACTKARIYLCRGCIGDHTVKYPDLMHQLVRADLEVSNLSAYRDRNEAFAAGIAELQQNLNRIDQCCQEVTVAFNEMIDCLGQWRDYYVRSLQEWKVTLSAEIAEAENEVKSTLAQDSVQLTGKYSALLRNYQMGTLQLFMYEIDTSGLDNFAQCVVKFKYSEVPKSESFETQISTLQIEEKLQPVRESNVSEENAQEAARLTQLAKSMLDGGNYAEASKLYAAADAFFSRLPNDINTAHNLKNWGNALFYLGHSAEAMAKYASADSIYSRFFPNDIHTANNLQNWGVALKNMGKSAEAVEKHAAADAIFARFFTNVINTAINLQNWGLALRDMGKSAEAVTKYVEADTIFARLFPNDINTAINLQDWGIALKNMGKSAEAVTKHAEADTIFARFFPSDINTAINLQNWGLALRDMEKSAKAVTKYAAADAIFSRFFPNDINTAHNLLIWGIALKNMGKSGEAMRKLAGARRIYGVKGRVDSVRTCDSEIAKLK